VTAPARLPIGPLLDYIERRYGPLRINVTDPDLVLSALTYDDVAAILGVNRDSLGRWVRRGWLDELVAERIALDLVGHPSILWRAEYAELAAAVA
jgi:hypothetical protein